VSCCAPLPQMALKASDLGHLAVPRQVHTQWVAALEEENFRQVRPAQRAHPLQQLQLEDSVTA
jgi:hypothetical protein